ETETGAALQHAKRIARLDAEGGIAERGDDLRIGASALHPGVAIGRAAERTVELEVAPGREADGDGGDHTRVVVVPDEEVARLEELAVQADAERARHAHVGRDQAQKADRTF